MNDVLTKNDLERPSKKLSVMSMTALRDFYTAAYCRCKLESDRRPKARDIQELVQAWKAMGR